MSGWRFNQTPVSVAKVSTKYRRIVTKLPVPATAAVFKKLEKFESRSMHGQLPVVWDKAVDFQVFDKYGNRWIDFTSTIFVANSGHSNSRVIKGVSNQLRQKLIHTYTFPSQVRADFLQKLIRITPRSCQKAFLLSSGTEATECALKLMRMHGRSKKKSKLGVISFLGGMHGRTMGAEFLKGDQKTSCWIGHNDPYIYHLKFPYPWIKSGRTNWSKQFMQDISNLKRKGLKSGDICGFMIESYIGWGAVLFPPEYIRTLVDYARKNGILVCFDEIQGGLGRTGKLFAFEHYRVQPDLLCLGKALSGGLPLSAVVGRRDIMDLPEVGSMSSTHSANPLCAAAGLANLEEIESKNLIKESARKGIILHQRLAEIKAKFPKRIFWICGKGLIAGIIIKGPKTNRPDSIFASRVCERAMRKGLLLVHTGREAIKIGPPLTIPDAALLEGINVLEQSIAEEDKIG